MPLSGLPELKTLPPDLAVQDKTWVEVRAGVDRASAELVDYQEQLEQRNQQLDAMRRVLDSILASVSDVLVVIDRSGMIEEVNASLVARSGEDRSALVGKAALTLFARANHPGITEGLLQLRTERRPRSLDVSLVATEGASALDLGLSVRLDDRGRMTRYVLAGRPTGELRQAYAELSRSHDHLKAAQALLARNEGLASLGRLLSGVAHDLNNPISFIHANAHALDRYVTKFTTCFDCVQAGADRAELVRLRDDLKQECEVRNLRTSAQGARDGAERVRDIVADPRRLSADLTGEMCDFDLVDTAEVATNWVQRGSKSAAGIRFAGLPRLRAHGREGHMQQLVMNLLQNTLDAVEGLADPQICVSASIEQGQAMLSFPVRSAA